MAAGLGFKDFTTGEVLTAADVDGYLMQGVWVFASAAARDASVTSPQEGNFAYLKDTNVTTYYTGSAWANLDTTGMTNPMTTTGDTIYSSSGSTPARLGIGTAGQVLKVNSGATAPEWGAPASGALVLVKAPTTFTNVANTGTTFDGVFTSTYSTYLIVIEQIYGGTSTDDLLFNLRYAGPSTQSAFYGGALKNDYAATTYSNTVTDNANLILHTNIGNSTSSYCVSTLTVQAGSAGYGPISGFTNNIDTATNFINQGFASFTQRTYTGFLLKSASSNVTGTVAVYAYARS
jgi:hypothetical protein